MSEQEASKPRRRWGGCAPAGTAAPLPLAGLLPYADDLPCPDFGLLIPLKRSPEYAEVRRQVADRRPVDAFLVDEQDHYFVFVLSAAGDAPAPYALFKMRHGFAHPLLAVLVAPDPDGRSATVTPIGRPGESLRVPLGDPEP
jgi:hypothetical protein